LLDTGGAPVALTIGNNSGPGSFSGALTGTGGSIIKTGLVEQVFNGTASSYTGSTTINQGTLNVALLANGGSNSSIGASSNAAANLVFGGVAVPGFTYGNTAILQYNANLGPVSTDRLFTLGDANGNNAVIDSSSNLSLQHHKLHQHWRDCLGLNGCAHDLTLGGTTPEQPFSLPLWPTGRP